MQGVWCDARAMRLPCKDGSQRKQTNGQTRTKHTFHDCVSAPRRRIFPILHVGSRPLGAIPPLCARFLTGRFFSDGHDPTNWRCR